MTVNGSQTQSRRTGTRLALAAAAATVVSVAAFRCTPDGGVEFALGEGGRWREAETREDDLLKPGVELSLWRLEMGVDHPPDKIVLREKAGCRSVRRVSDLGSAIQLIDSPEKAIRYSEMLRLFEIDPSEVPGEIVEREPWEGDAALWAVGTKPVAATEPDGSHVVTRPVYFSGRESPAGDGVPCVAHLREWIGPRGEYRFEIARVLLSGSAAGGYSPREFMRRL